MFGPEILEEAGVHVADLGWGWKPDTQNTAQHTNADLFCYRQLWFSDELFCADLLTQASPADLQGAVRMSANG